MKFELFDVNGNPAAADEIVSYELVSDAQAPCDGLRLNFISQSSIGEICIVKAYCDERLVFNGFCDKQKTEFSKNGINCYIYARSSAALLVDNEAVPCRYSNPSSRQLWFSNAKELGFECCLPEIYSEHSYLVSKGTSCYGAINDYISAQCKAPVYATPDNELRIYEQSKEIKRLDDYRILSLSYIINRGVLISDIDYKINSADNYSYHLKSELTCRMGIQRKRLFNLSSATLGQREMTVQQKMNSALDNYYSVCAEFAGDCDFRIFDRVAAAFKMFEINEDFYVSEIVKSKNRSGEKTAVVLKKKLNGELINYVA